MYEYDLLSLALLFFTGVLAGVINVMAGVEEAVSFFPCSYSLESIPRSRTEQTGWRSCFRIFSRLFRSEKEGVADIKTGVKLAAFTLPGVLVGAFAAVRVGDELFEKILAVVLIFVCASFFLKVDSFGKLLGGPDGARPGWILYPALVLIGFYGGFIQVGVGLFIMAALYHLMGASPRQGERAQGNHCASLHGSRNPHILSKRKHKLVYRYLSCRGKFCRRVVRRHVFRKGR